MDRKVKRTVQAALLAAFTCVATVLIRIPAPLGYLHAGDGLVLLCGWLLGPGYGALAAGIGSALADVAAGYVTYAPATLLLKGGMAALAAWLLRVCVRRRPAWPLRLACVLSALLPVCGMACGYFLFNTWLMHSVAAAAVALPGDLVQGAVGIAIAALLFPLCRKSMQDPRR